MCLKKAKVDTFCSKNSFLPDILLMIYILMKLAEYKYKGTYSAVMPSVVPFISVPRPFLLSVSFRTKTEHLDWVLELSSKDQQFHNWFTDRREGGTVI